MADNAQVIDALQAYILSKKYTEDTCNALGFVKGANAVIKSIDKHNGQNIVTFEWTGVDGEIESSRMYVDDGTPIYVWESGKSYTYGDLAIFESSFYRCLIDNSDIDFDGTKWQEIGSPDGNYDIVPNRERLPTRFTSADKKLFYAYEENIFYFWNGEEWEANNTVVQSDKMPDASILFNGRILQYIGVSNDNYTHGFFYECKEINGGYNWESLDTQKVDGLTNEQLTTILSLF